MKGINKSFFSRMLDNYQKETRSMFTATSMDDWCCSAWKEGKRQTIFPRVSRNHFLWRGSWTCAFLHFSPKPWNRKPVESKCKIPVSQHALKKQINIDSKNGRENAPALLYKLKGFTRSIHEQLLARQLVEGTC